MEASALASPSFFAYYLSDALQFVRHLLVGRDDGVKRVRDLAGQSRPGAGKAHRKIAIAHGLQAGQNDAEIGEGG